MMTIVVVVVDVHPTAGNLVAGGGAREECAAALVVDLDEWAEAVRLCRTTMPFSFKPDVEPLYVICRFTGARPVAVVVTFWPRHPKPAGRVTPSAVVLLQHLEVPARHTSGDGQLAGLPAESLRGRERHGDPSATIRDVQVEVPLVRRRVRLRHGGVVGRLAALAGLTLLLDRRRDGERRAVAAAAVAVRNTRGPKDSVAPGRGSSEASTGDGRAPAGVHVGSENAGSVLRVVAPGASAHVTVNVILVKLESCRRWRRRPVGQVVVAGGRARRLH